MRFCGRLRGRREYHRVTPNTARSRVRLFQRPLVRGVLFHREEFYIHSPLEGSVEKPSGGEGIPIIELFTVGTGPRACPWPLRSVTTGMNIYDAGGPTWSGRPRGQTYMSDPYGNIADRGERTTRPSPAVFVRRDRSRPVPTPPSRRTLTHRAFSTTPTRGE